jgi:hypothetical protein
MSVRGLVASSAVLFALALAADAQADDRQEKKVCAQASEEAQQLRTDGHPREARERLLVCVRDVCPQVVRKDCTLWLAEVEAALPSVVINARDGQGHDLVNVRVTLDGKPFTDKVDGKSIAVNPGIHVFRYEADDAPPIEEKVVVREGEKNRELVVTFKTPGPAVAPVPEPPTPPGVVAPSPAPAAHSGPPALTYVLAGVAVVAAGGYAYLGIQGKNDVDNLRSTCAPACSQSQKDSASQQLLGANISFGVGVASLAAAAIVWIASPGKAAPSTTSATTASRTPVFDVQGLPHGGFLSLGARF